MKKLQVGMSKGDITPNVGGLLYGYPSKRLSEKILDNLKVGVVAIRQENETLLLIATDLCSISFDTCTYIRKLIAKEIGVKAENVVLSAIHTHSGPITRTAAGWGKVDIEYVNEIMIPACIDTAKKALASLKPALMGVGITESYAGINRRELKDGEIILGQNPSGPYDPQMTLISFKNTAGEFIGSIVHFATHPTSAGPNRNITRDWPGYIVDKVEELTGAPCMYVNGAEGDIGPRLSNGKTIADDTYIAEIGNIAARDVEKAYLNLGEFAVPELKLETGDLVLPYVEAPSYESVLADMKAMGNPEDLIEVDITKYARLKKIKEMYESGESFEKGLTLKQTVISLGDIAIVPMPFEIFCNIALSLKEKSPYKTTLLFGLSNGSFGYLPTEEQLPYGGYEIASFRAASIPGFIDGLDKVVVSENVKFLNKLNSK